MDKLFINNEWIQGLGPELNTINPATGQISHRLMMANESQAEDAILSARSSFDIWRKKTFEQRKQVLERYAQLLEQYKNELVDILTQETGKPFWEAATEVASAIGKVTISIQAYQQRTPEQTIINDQPNYIGYTHKPHGVLIVLGPYNFPLHLPNGHIVPAILAGNCIVFKPSKYAPRTGLMIAKLLQLAGLPKGVINVMIGDPTIGQALLKSEHIQGVLFTGSYQTGQLIHQQFAGKVDKVLALEMGGNNPLVIWDIKDIKAACYHTILSAYITAGQRCSCARRLILPNNKLGDAIIKQLKIFIENIKVGEPNKKAEAFMGPVMTQSATQQLLSTQATLLNQGANIIVKMENMIQNTGLLTPGLIDVSDVSNLSDDEYFGPLLQIIRVNDFEQAISVANQTQYGLTAGLFSDDAKLFEYFQQEINAGVVNFNRQLTGASSKAPFGGVGWSGNHRPSAYYAADYCAYPVAGMQSQLLTVPTDIKIPGFKV